MKSRDLYNDDMWIEWNDVDEKGARLFNWEWRVGWQLTAVEEFHIVLPDLEKIPHLGGNLHFFGNFFQIFM